MPYADDIVLLAQFGELLQLTADLVGQEAACTGLLINPVKTKFLAITMKHTPALDYSQLSINLSGWMWPLIQQHLLPRLRPICGLWGCCDIKIAMKL